MKLAIKENATGMKDIFLSASKYSWNKHVSNKFQFMKILHVIIYYFSRSLLPSRKPVIDTNRCGDEKKCRQNYIVNNVQSTIIFVHS